MKEATRDGHAVTLRGLIRNAIGHGAHPGIGFFRDRLSSEICERVVIRGAIDALFRIKTATPLLQKTGGNGRLLEAMVSSCLPEPTESPLS